MFLAHTKYLGRLVGHVGSRMVAGSFEGIPDAVEQFLGAQASRKVALLLFLLGRLAALLAEIFGRDDNRVVLIACFCD